MAVRGGFLTLPLAAAAGVLSAFVVGGIGITCRRPGRCAVIGIAPHQLLLVRSYQRGQPRRPCVGPDARLRRGDGSCRSRAARWPANGLLRSCSPRWRLALAFLPLLFLGDTAGTEILYPLAVVVLGGLVTSTVLGLFVIPGLYLLLTRGSAGDRVAPSAANPEPIPAPVLIPS